MNNCIFTYCISLFISLQSLNKATLHALGLAIGDTVYISGKRGILLYCGPTEFASGQWAGIALSEPSGKNDGSVGGVRYFNCEAKHGIFAPVSRVKKVPADFQHGLAKQSSNESAGMVTPNVLQKLQIRVATFFANSPFGTLAILVHLDRPLIA
eukprot:Seg6397.1 transcript_id=Seg6397.1/GoldUCD/mRNA.D3Y31 product="CAP-Gly domain-containing linker protein 4" protein_id=Seg6397.1/GoldUCD/D3Y31